MADINVRYNVLIPEMPKMLDKEQISVYVPSPLVDSLINLDGEYTIGSKNSNNSHTGMYGLIIGRDNDANSRAIIFGSENKVHNDAFGPFNFVCGDRHEVNKSEFTFVGGRDSVVDTAYNCFIYSNGGKIYNQRDSMFVGWALDVLNDVKDQGYGNIVIGHYRTGENQFTIRNIRLSTLLGAYHFVDNSYADVIVGATNTLKNTEKCFVSGFRNNLASTTGDIIGGLYNNVEGQSTDIFTSSGNGVYGNNNRLIDCQNSSVFGYKNIVNGSQNVCLFGSNNILTNSTTTLAYGDSLSVQNCYYTTVFGRDLTTDTGSYGDLSRDALIIGRHSVVKGVFDSVISATDSLEINTIGYSVVSGYNLNVKRVMGSLVVGFGHQIGPSRYLIGSDGRERNSSYNLIGGESHTIYAVWRSVIGGGPDSDGNGNHFEDIWNSNIVGTDIRAYNTHVSAVFGGAHRVGSYNDSDYMYMDKSNPSVYRVLISGYGHKIKTAQGDAVFGEQNTLSSAKSNIVSGTSNTLSASYRNAVSGVRNHLTNCKGCQVSGYDNTLSNVEKSIIGGEKNTLTGGCLYNVCLGTGNGFTTNEYCTVFGNSCTISSGSIHNFLHGYNMKVTSGSYSAMVGASCQTSASYTFTAGYGLINQCQHQVMAGKFATNHTNTTNRRYLFCLGDGVSSSVRKDALLFYADNSSGTEEYFLKLGTLTISETKMKKIMDFIDTIT